MQFVQQAIGTRPWGDGCNAWVTFLYGHLTCVPAGKQVQKPTKQPHIRWSGAFVLGSGTGGFVCGCID